MSQSVALHNGETGSVKSSFGEKRMSVVMFATQRPENVAGSYAARVNFNPRELCKSVLGADKLPVRRGYQGEK